MEPAPSKSTLFAREQIEVKMNSQVRSMNTANAVKKKSSKCPSCGGGEVRRSQMRGLLERGILRFFGIHAYRCQDCDRRYYAMGPLENRRDKLNG